MADRDGLPAALASLPSEGGTGMTLIERVPLPFAGISPKELLLCELGDGRSVKVFCKHSYSGRRAGHGQRVDVAYEADVYRRVLEPLDLRTARFYGSHEGGPGSQSWLFLEYLEGAGMVHKAGGSNAVVRAAEWIGRFHASTERLLARGEAPLDRRFDEEYYAGWARRTAGFVGDRPELAWVGEVCAGFERYAIGLLMRRAAVAHGEYDPKNILILKGEIYPVDWECAVIAAGEIDLAALTAGWPDDFARRCERAYAAARWPYGRPPDFEQTLAAARLYTVLRWLGARTDWTNGPGGAAYLRALRDEAVAAGLLPDEHGRRRDPRRGSTAADGRSTTAPPPLPADDELERVLRSSIRDPDVELVSRQPPPSGGSYPSEVVTCGVRGGRDVTLYCKYGHSVSGQEAHGHRGGVAYEAEVYRRVLEPLRMPTARLHGRHTDGHGSTWLLLEYLDGADPVHRTTDEEAIVEAARWVGRLHGAAALAADEGGLRFLNRYDMEYYRGWVRRANLFGADWQPPFTWLQQVCEGFEDLFEELADSPRTVVHGEYYPKNVLWRDGVVYPLDWESAAIAPGELDLAMITEGWADDVVAQCELAYARERWPAGAPPGFERRLALSRAYAHFRWLGDNWDWTMYSSESPSRWERLRLDAERLGLV